MSAKPSRALTRISADTKYWLLVNGQRVVRMSDDQFRRHWIRVVFAGNPVTPPQGFDTVADAVKFVATHRGALAFVNGPVDASVRILLIDGRALFDLLPGEINEKHFSIRIKMAKRMWRYQDLAIGKPSARVSYQIAYGPILIVEVEVSDVPNLAVGGPQFLSVTFLNAV